eukprot:12895973-Prorocentrum_lima.AAC.1
MAAAAASAGASTVMLSFGNHGSNSSISRCIHRHGSNIRSVVTLQQQQQQQRQQHHLQSWLQHHICSHFG